MTFSELRVTIDERLESEPRLHGSRRELHGESSVWTREKQVIVIGPSGSTGIRVEYISDGQPLRTKIFALSPMSVDRIVISSAEHLTCYAFHRTSA
jgi:hypothetical protein